MSTRIRVRDLMRSLTLTLALAGLALACASSPSGDAPHEVLHEGFGVRVDLDGWQVYRDAASSPGLVRPLFKNKRGPDDPPLFVAVRGDVIFTLLVQPGVSLDSQGFFERFASGIAPQGEVLHAARLPGSDDIVSSYRLGSGAFTSYSRALVHVDDGRLVNAMFVRTGEIPTEQLFADALGRIELRGDAGWKAPWDLPVPIAGEALAGYEGGPVLEAEDPFEAVECAPGRHPLLWAVPARNGGRLYLFGSIHVGHASFYPFARPIEEAFEGADRLVVEIDSSAMGEDLSPQTLQAGTLPAGQELSDIVSPELYARLGAAAKQLGLPLQMFDAMSPGTAGVVLSLAPLLARGFDPEAGVDRYFMQRAQGKQIVELETLEQQLALIGSFDESFLSAALDGLATIDADLDALHGAWRCGDEEALAYTLLELPRERAGTPEDRAQVDAFNEVFLNERNREMARRIEELLAADGDSFVVLGAAHLVGEQGIPALLRAAGHPVEIVDP